MTRANKKQKKGEQLQPDAEPLDQHHRMNYLAQMGNQCDSPTLASYFAKQMLKTSTKTSTRVTAELKRQLCMQCSCVLKAGENWHHRVRMHRNRRFVRLCDGCKVRSGRPAKRPLSV